ALISCDMVVSGSTRSVSTSLSFSTHSTISVMSYIILSASFSSNSRHARCAILSSSSRLIFMLPKLVIQFRFNYASHFCFEKMHFLYRVRGGIDRFVKDCFHRPPV